MYIAVLFLQFFAFSKNRLALGFFWKKSENQRTGWIWVFLRNSENQRTGWIWVFFLEKLRESKNRLVPGIFFDKLK
jgi:hypothetical protein